MRHDNIFLTDTTVTYNYSSSPSYGGKAKIPQRIDRNLHSEKLIEQLLNAQKAFEGYSPQQVAVKKYNTGTYVEFSGAENCDLITKSLEDARQGIRLLNIRDIVTFDDKTDTNSVVTKATVFIPHGKERVFIKKIEDFATQQTRSGKPKNNDLVSSIESISNALKISSFWVGRPSEMPTDKENWYELWIDVVEERFEETKKDTFAILDALHTKYKHEYIRFPEKLIVLVYANCAKLLDIIYQGVTIAEIRKNADPNQFFTESTLDEQTPWVDDLLSRTNYVDSGVVVCILDTGINRNHKLITPYMQTQGMAIESAWGTSDHDGHGTNMAGIVLYNDLKRYLIQNTTYNLNHSIESVKILPPKSQNVASLYGAITEQAVLLSEITNPMNRRVYCMAVTDATSSTNDGLPTSWSATIDQLSALQKRLFLVSAGNVDSSFLQKNGYFKACELKSVEDPAQAWNALSIGAYTQDAIIQPSQMTRGFHAVAQVNELSPYSSTSFSWKQQWPIKPELLCDGGNVATDGTNYFNGFDDLSKLTLNKDISQNLFDTLWATSAATAQCSYIAAELYATYPDLWPETIRALLIHSARWTDEMKNQFGFPDNKTQGRRKLLRMCGYGIPSLERARDTFDNRINMIIESELQPYEKAPGGRQRMKEMQLHLIPWPKETLASLENQMVKMRVTLSYFIEPGPGEKGWKNKYRYASCGLRFDIKKPNETLEEFKARINSIMRDEDYKRSNVSSNNWYLGPSNRDVGSIHSDVWEDTAIGLSQSEYIAVFPVVGWWRERTNLKKINSKIRYSLVVSIESPDVNVDLYTPIMTKISNRIKVPIEIGK